MNELENLQAGLSKYLPAEAVESLSQYLYSHPIQLTITRSRLTKLGDYRPPYKKEFHRISINGDLNPYHFLWTLVHEIAHFEVFTHYGNTVKPHGREWQQCFATLIRPYILADVFPDSIGAVLIKHIDKPKASSCSDPLIYKAFCSLNSVQSLFLDDIPEGSTFRFGNAIYKKGNKKRTRYLCTKVADNKKYLVNGVAEVEIIQ